MDPREVFEYAKEGMKWLAIGGFGVMNYFVTLMAAKEVFQHAPFRRSIESQEELEEIVDVEVMKLGLDPTNICSKYNAESSYVVNNKEGYDLHLGAGDESTIATVRHELYHIYKDDKQT